MKLFKSEKGIPLPTVFFVTSEEELKEIPLGIPFIRGKDTEYEKCLMFLEFTVLFKSAQDTGLKFNWEKILREKGYKQKFTTTLAKSSFTEGTIGYYDIEARDYLRDISYQVDVEVLKTLNIIPSWFGDIEKNIKENILNSIMYNPSLYNKKYDMAIGDIELNMPDRNLICIDISGSIPKSISETILVLAKTMSLQFYADLLITGSKSTLYDYTEVGNLDVETVYVENGMDNDHIYFKKLVTETPRKYNTLIIFGDEHSPSMRWNNEYNDGTITTEAVGKLLNKWTFNTCYSFHTTSGEKLAGYAKWFTPGNVIYMKNWVTYLN